MADFPTECPGDSDVTSEAVSWKLVDDSEAELVNEQRVKELTTKPKEEEPAQPAAATSTEGFGADFSSEPEEVTVKQPLLGKDFTVADAA